MDRSVVDQYLSPLTTDATPYSSRGRLRSPLRCLLCDIYGTLLISSSGDIGSARKQEPRHIALGELLTRFGLDEGAGPMLQKLFTAIEKEHNSARGRGVDHPEVEIDKVWAGILPFKTHEKIRNFAVQWEMVMNPVWPMPGLLDLLTVCRNRGVLLGIISNAQFFTPLLFQWLLDTDLADLGFDRQTTFFSYRHGRAKPSGLLFEMAAERLDSLGISPHETAYIGNDMRNDILPARSIGFQTILFAGDSKSLRMRTDDPQCVDLEPDLRITHLNQLPGHMFNV